MTKQTLHTEIIALCDYATISREGKVSINGIFDEFRPPEVPVVLPRFFFVSILSGSVDTSYSLSIKMEFENKPTENLPSFDMDLRTSMNGRANIIIELGGVRFEKEGKYQFKIYNRKEEIGSTALTVVKTIPNEAQSIKQSN